MDQKKNKEENKHPDHTARHAAQDDDSMMEQQRKPFEKQSILIHSRIHCALAEDNGPIMLVFYIRENQAQTNKHRAS